MKNKKDYIKYIREQVGHNPVIMTCSAAVIYKDGKVLMQRRKDNGKLAITGGYMELGETPTENLKRELLEELGIIPTKYELMGVISGEKMHYIYPNGDETYVNETLFLVTDFEKVTDKTDGEVIETMWIDVNKIPKDIHEPDKPVIPFFKNYLKDHVAKAN